MLPVRGSKSLESVYFMRENINPKAQSFASRKLAFGGLLLAISLVLPQLFHGTGIPRSGEIFLPMHIPVLLAGFVLGPLYGGAIGALAPLLSSLITGMPPPARLPFMIFELAAYGLLSGLFYYRLRLGSKPGGIYISLLLAMVGGRLVYGGFLLVAGAFTGTPITTLGALGVAITTGAVGILIQILLLPPIVLALRKGGLLYGNMGAGEKNTNRS